MIQRKPIRVLIFPAGSEIAIEVYDALKFQKDVELYGAASVDDHSRYLYRHLAADLPFFNDPSFIDRLNEVLEGWDIDFIYPARDDVQLFLTQHEAELPARVVTAPLDTVATCRSKAKTYAHLAGEPFVPKTYAAPHEVVSWPIFAKPAEGEGSKGAQLVDNASEMERLLSSSREYVFCEYLPGTEYTVDCLSDKDGRLLAAIPRTRARTKAGISVQSTAVEDASVRERVRQIALAINERFVFAGAWFFQLRERADGELILMEVSPRIPGTMGLSRNLGINFPLLSIYALLGMDFEVAPNSYPISLDKAFISRYDIDWDYDTVYIDYDDTLYLGDEVNWQAMAFLYQCKNRGKRIVLLTRHDDAVLGPLEEHMQKRGIARELFDKVVHLTKAESKAGFITEKRAVFIDDSFRERADVRENCQIPVFDLGNIEALLDWRM